MKFNISRMKSRLISKVLDLEFNTLHNYVIDDTYSLTLDKDFILIENKEKDTLIYTTENNIHKINYQTDTVKLTCEYNDITQKSTLNINQINLKELNEIETPANMHSLFKVIKDFESITKELNNNKLYTLKEILDNINEKKRQQTLKYDSVDYELKDIFDPIQQLNRISGDKDLFIKELYYSERKDLKILSISLNNRININKKFNKKTKVEEYSYSNNYFIEENLKNILISQDIKEFEKNKVEIEKIFSAIHLEKMSYDNHKEQIEAFLNINKEVKRKPKL